MKRIRIPPFQSPLQSSLLLSSFRAPCIHTFQTQYTAISRIHTTPSHPATVIPSASAAGPPPKAPEPTGDVNGDESVQARIARRRKQAEILRGGLRGGNSMSGAGMGGVGGSKGGVGRMKRFWKDVNLKSTPGSFAHPHLPTHSINHQSFTARIPNN